MCAVSLHVVRRVVKLLYAPGLVPDNVCQLQKRRSIGVEHAPEQVHLMGGPVTAVYFSLLLLCNSYSSKSVYFEMRSAQVQAFNACVCVCVCVCVFPGKS